MAYKIYMDAINVALVIQEFLYKERIFITYKTVLIFLIVTTIQNTKDLVQ